MIAPDFARDLQIADAMPRLEKLFTTLPRAAVEVGRVPAFIQDGAANGYYQGPAPDGSRPGRFVSIRRTRTNGRAFSWPR